MVDWNGSSDRRDRPAEPPSRGNFAMKYLLEMSYIGSRFAGFQVQPGKVTVQSTLQDSIEAVFGERLPVKGCSRTDSGVHARQYFATFEAMKLIPPNKLPLALNSNLPPDISVR